MLQFYSIVLPVLLQSNLEECGMDGASAQLEEATVILQAQAEEPKLVKAQIDSLKLPSQNFAPLQDAIKDYETIRDLKALAAKLEGNDELKKEMRLKIDLLEKSLSQRLANSFGKESILKSINAAVPNENLEVRLGFDKDLKESDPKIILYQLNMNALEANQLILKPVELTNLKKSIDGRHMDLRLPMLESRMTYLVVVKSPTDSTEPHFVMFTTKK